LLIRIQRTRKHIAQYRFAMATTERTDDFLLLAMGDDSAYLRVFANENRRDEFVYLVRLRG
jgi:hypothetical protein